MRAPLFFISILQMKTFNSTCTPGERKEVCDRISKKVDARLAGIIVNMCKKLSYTEFALLSSNSRLTGVIMSEVVCDYIRPGQMN